MARAASLALALLSAQAAAAGSGRRLAVVDLATPPSMVGLGFQVSQAVVDAARTAGLVVLPPAELRKTMGEEKYTDLTNCGPVPACVSGKLGTFSADQAVLGALRRDEKNYLLQLWLVDLQKQEVIASVDRAILIASRRLIPDTTEAIPPLLRGEGERRGFLTVTSAVKGVDVVLNGEEVGQAPVTRELKPGRYEIQLSKKNYMAVKRLVDVNAGKTTVEDVRMILLPGMRPPEEPEAVASGTLRKRGDEGGGLLPWPAWVAFGAGAASACVGGYAGLQARGIEASLKGGQDPVTGVFTGTRREAIQGREQAVLANVLFGVAAVGVGAGVAFTLLMPVEGPALKAAVIPTPAGAAAVVQGEL